MRDSSRSVTLSLGILWIAIWIIMLFFRISKLDMQYILYVIPGIILVIISLYNWGAGMDLKKKTEIIENDGHDFELD